MQDAENQEFFRDFPIFTMEDPNHTVPLTRLPPSQYFCLVFSGVGVALPPGFKSRKFLFRNCGCQPFTFHFLTNVTFSALTFFFSFFPLLVPSLFLFEFFFFGSLPPLIGARSRLYSFRRCLEEHRSTTTRGDLTHHFRKPRAAARSGRRAAGHGHGQRRGVSGDVQLCRWCGERRGQMTPKKIIRFFLKVRNTLPETNSSHLKRDYFNSKYIFQASILRCKPLVSGRVRVGNLQVIWKFLRTEKIGCLEISEKHPSSYKSFFCLQVMSCQNLVA